jgi:hypothetical protein
MNDAMNFATLPVEEALHRLEADPARGLSVYRMLQRLGGCWVASIRTKQSIDRLFRAKGEIEVHHWLLPYPFLSASTKTGLSVLFSRTQQVSLSLPPSFGQFLT